MPFRSTFLLFSIIMISALACNPDDGQPPVDNTDRIQLILATIGNTSLLTNDPGLPTVPIENEITLKFNQSIQTPAESFFELINTDNQKEDFSVSLLDNGTIVLLNLANDLEENKPYTLNIDPALIATNGATFPGLSIPFQTTQDELQLTQLSIQGRTLDSNAKNTEIPLTPIFTIEYSHEVPIEDQKDNLVLVGEVSYDFDIEKIGALTYTLTPNIPLKDFSKINLLIPSSLGTAINRPFSTLSYVLYTEVSTEPKFPLISDEELLTKVQEQTFKYFWDFAHPASGMARERNTSQDLVTSGGSGFGLMTMIVGVERGFISRQDALDRWRKIFDFLEGADRFHGVWSHWINGNTGDVIPFSAKDNGADLVETAFLVQGMLTVRQYLNANIPEEQELIDQINMLWEAVEWSWFTRGGQNVLYWHWSPEFNWEMNLPIRGHNETQIVYTLAAASPTFSISPEVYKQGYARSGDIINGNDYYDINLPVGYSKGGPLFFSHYSYLGMDPRNLEDQYANYWTQNINHSKINQAHCIENPSNHVGYSAQCWGLTASDNDNGYSAHSPTNDLGVITPTAALSSMPYTPDLSMEALKHFYYQLGDRLWGEYGFYDAFNPTEGWVANSFLAIDQGPIIIMIENHRTALLWDLYMSAPEVQSGLDKLGINY